MVTVEKAVPKTRKEPKREKAGPRGEWASGRCLKEAQAVTLAGTIGTTQRVGMASRTNSLNNRLGNMIDLFQNALKPTSCFSVIQHHITQPSSGHTRRIDKTTGKKKTGNENTHNKETDKLKREK
jgi:hypothetical protein